MQSPGLARRSVRANVELALAWWGVPRRHRRERAAQALQRLRVQHLADRPALSLSGGEKRRVHLARAMAVEADLLLLDEPFVGLDPQAHADLCDDASSALRASTGGVLLVVHDRAEAWAMADRLVVLGEGRIVAEGTPCALLERPPTADVARFLGYDGELHDDHGVLLTRPVHVSVDPGGDIEATLTQVVLREDGARLTLDTGRGIVRAQITGGVSSTRVGDHLRLHIDGGVRFPDQ